MRCPECLTELPERVKFCKECGKRLELTCPECGQSLPPDSKFCLECGYNLSTAFDSTPPRELSFPEKLAKIQRFLPKSLAKKVFSEKDKIEGERRQVTIMFVDMKGFTPLTEKLGPEDTFSLMDRVFEILIRTIHDYEGTVNELRGDGVLALFGAPIALEDAPQRAIRSALDIHREVAKLSEKITDERKIPPILLRIGINSGPVVVGTVGSDLRIQFTAVGDTINLAARMEQLAEPGTTYVTEDTFKLTRGFFRFAALGPKRVKGKQKPVRVYRVIGPSSKRRRFDVSAETGLTCFVGRERELGLMFDGLERCKEGRGHALFIVGEAGVGKSRLLYEFRKAVAEEEVTFLEGRCFFFSKRTAFYPVIEILKSGFDIGPGDAHSIIREKVEKGLQFLRVDKESTLPYLLELLSVKDSGFDSIPVSAEARKDRMFEAVKRIIVKHSEREPLILVLEDLHWMDKSSEEVSKRILESIPGLPILLIFTYRPEFRNNWGRKSFHHRIDLNPLHARESLAMLTHLVGTADLPNDLEDLILKKTEGVPFFIEEFVKSLRDLKIIEKRDHRCCLARGLNEVTIPATIQDVVLARVDSLPDAAKEVLQIGAAIEREFAYGLIRRVAGISESELLERLSVLSHSELLYERGIFPESTYVFKHALIQDVCYQTLLKSTCRKYHRRIGEVIERHFSGLAEEHPEMLGHHFAKANLLEKAIPYLQRAGEIAIRRGAHVEAMNHLNHALELLNKLPDVPDRKRQELDLRIALGPALMAAKGYAAPEVEEAYDRSRHLCNELGSPPQFFAVLRGLWTVRVTRGNLRSAHTTGLHFFDLAQRTESPALFLWSYFMLGMTLAHVGEPVKAREYLQQGLDLYDVHKRGSHRALQDPGVFCLCVKSVVLWLLGHSEQALRASRDAVVLAQSLSHPFSVACAHYITAMVMQLCREVQEVRRQVEAANALCIEQNIPFWLPWGIVLRGWALTNQGEREAGITQMRRGLTEYTASGARLNEPYFLALLADAYAKGGRADKGLDTLARALVVANRSNERWCEGELHRLRGDLLLAVSSRNGAEAESCYLQAMDVARRRGTKMFELRAATSLSRLWKEGSRQEEARLLISTVYGQFTEGFDSPDLAQARLLLAEL